MASLEIDIDSDIKKYFFDYLVRELNIVEINYELIKPKRRCVFRIRINGVLENLVVEYQEDFINEYSVYFKTTASSEFFERFLRPILKTKTVNYTQRFDLMFSKIEQIGTKFKIFKKITMVNNSIISTRIQLDRTSGIEYTVLSSHRNMTVSINEDLYKHQKKLHYFKTMIYFSFKAGVLSAECLIFNQSMETDKVDIVELWLSGNEAVFLRNLRKFQKDLEAFAVHELFQPIHIHYGIPFSQIIDMSEEDLKPYVDVVSMMRI